MRCQEVICEMTPNWGSIRDWRIVNRVNGCEWHVRFTTREVTGRNDVSTSISNEEQKRSHHSNVCQRTQTAKSFATDSNRHVRPRASSISSLRHSDDVFVTYSTIRNRSRNNLTMIRTYLISVSVAAPKAVPTYKFG